MTILDPAVTRVVSLALAEETAAPTADDAEECCVDLALEAPVLAPDEARLREVLAVTALGSSPPKNAQ